MMHLISTFFLVGHLRPAPGTWGSVAALPVAWAIYALGGIWVFMGAAILLIPLGWWAIRHDTAGQPDHDPSEIVIDEVAGQWIALMPVMIGAAYASVPVLALWPGWITAFVAFRLFDIWKPGPVGWADRRPDAWGVMLDDVIAGVIAAVVVIVAAAVSHGVMML